MVRSVNELTGTPRFEEAWRNMLLLYKYSMYRNDFRFIMSQYQVCLMTKLLSRLLDGRLSKINHSFNSLKWLHPSPFHLQMWAQVHLVSPDRPILSPTKQLRKIQSMTRGSPSDSRKSGSSNRTQSSPTENDIEDTEVFINGVPIMNGDSALGADDMIDETDEP